MHRALFVVVPRNPLKSIVDIKVNMIFLHENGENEGEAKLESVLR